MNSKIIRIALNIVIVFFVGQARADKKCYKPSTVAQLQAAVDETQETFVEGVPNILLLCAGTEVTFKKGDPPIKYKTTGGDSYVMRCESYAMSHGEPCVIDGGGEFQEGEIIDGLDIYKPADNSDRRIYLGSGGFLTVTSGTVFFEGLVVKNFAVTAFGGAIAISEGASAYFYKCIFSRNSVKGNDSISNGGAIDILGAFNVDFKECNFHLNSAVKGKGGAIYVGDVVSLKIESCLFKENIAYEGGGVFAEGGQGLTFSMRSVAFVSNVAFRGGGVVLDNVDCRWYDVDFNGNDSAELGDAVAAKQRVILRGAKIDYHKDTVEKWCRFVDGFALY